MRLQRLWRSLSRPEAASAGDGTPRRTPVDGLVAHAVAWGAPASVLGPDPEPEGAELNDRNEREH